MIKNIFSIIAVALIVLTSCKKDETVVTTTPVENSVSFTNANGSSKTVNFFVEGVQKSATSVAANGTITGTYVGLNNVTSNLISIKDATVPTTEYYSGTIATVAGKAYTFIVYDTLISGKFKGILLNSDRTIAENNISTANVRFLNLSPKSPSLDLWMVRSFGTVAKDSINLGARPYLGSVASPDALALSAFTNVPANEVAGSAGVGSLASSYVLKLKLSGTGTVVFTSAATNIIPARNYTIFARGTYPSSALTILLNN